MLKELFIIVILSLSWRLGITQKKEFELDIRNKKIQYFRDVERKLGSTKFNSDIEYVSADNTAQPEIYLRKEKNIPDLLVYYTFLKTDSTIFEIKYEWDVANFEKKDNNKKPIDFELRLIEKYNSIIKLVSAKYGKSKTEGSLANQSKLKKEESLERTDLWMPSQDWKIYAYAVISNYYKKDGFITFNPSHRIRLFIYNLKGQKQSNLL